jgi:serine/threonine protein kinase
MKPYGYFDDHKEKLKGLIVEDLSIEFTPIASPPDFVSCTRDVYNGIRISKESREKAIGLLKEACNYLHKSGIMHGDIYGHNTYMNFKSSEIKIGDFGASSFVLDEDAEYRIRIDNRAIDILTREIDGLCIN